ncbi:hypothetical protein [Aeromonas sobria]|uniref:hypothetical protein n=1 Tax=Aeromonas sobria TaxID=646 RepID=UPI003F345C9C
MFELKRQELWLPHWVAAPSSLILTTLLKLLVIMSSSIIVFFGSVYGEKRLQTEIVLHTALARFDTEFYLVSPKDEQLKSTVL